MSECLYILASFDTEEFLKHLQIALSELLRPLQIHMPFHTSHKPLLLWAYVVLCAMLAIAMVSQYNFHCFVLAVIFFLIFLKSIILTHDMSSSRSKESTN